MSVNRVVESTGELITLSSGVRCWIGTKAAHTVAVANHTIPNNVMVCITDDWKNKDDYSTEETDTGKHWIDGKPVYRKVITGNVPTTSTDGVPISERHSVGNNVSQMIEMRGYVRGGDNYENLHNIYDGVGTDAPWYVRLVGFNASTCEIQITNSRAVLSDKPFYVIVEYTKTTD